MGKGSCFRKMVWHNKNYYLNDLENNYPSHVNSTLTGNSDIGFLVSVRAPLNRKYGADELVSQFLSVDGRKAAAGINHFTAEMLE